MPKLAFERNGTKWRWVLLDAQGEIVLSARRHSTSKDKAKQQAMADMIDLRQACDMEINQAIRKEMGL